MQIYRPCNWRIVARNRLGIEVLVYHNATLESLLAGCDEQVMETKERFPTYRLIIQEWSGLPTHGNWFDYSEYQQRYAA